MYTRISKLTIKLYETYNAIIFLKPNTGNYNSIFSEFHAILCYVFFLMIEKLINESIVYHKSVDK